MKYVVLAAVTALLLSCGAATRSTGSRSGSQLAAEPPAGDPLRVVAGVLPVRYLAEQIGGTQVRADLMVPPGREPHTYEPTPQQIAVLSRAQIYVAVGMPFEEALLPKITASVPTLTVVDLRKGVPLRPIDGGSRITFGPGSATDAALDPHIWLGPHELAIEAATLRDAFTAARPASRALFDSNFRSFIERLNAVDRRIAEMLRPLDGRSILVFHPAFGYFTDTYGIRQLSIEQNGREPGPRALLDVINRARAAGVHSVFVEPEFAETTAKRIAEALKVQVVTINPLEPDVLANFTAMAKAFLAGTAAPAARQGNH